MQIIGLTGGIGSGKTTVAKIFSKFKNIAVYIADVEAKNLMNSCEVIRKNIIEKFGEESYKDNQLNRKYIADIVFKDKEKLSQLNKIVHPEVRKHFQEFVKMNSNKSYIIYENAILFESKSNLFCDIIITVYATLETKIQRVIVRDSCSRIEVLNRMKNQWKDDKKLLQSNYVILNENLDKTEDQVNKIHNILTQN